MQSAIGAVLVVLLLVGLLPDVVGMGFVGFFGALAGLLYPPKDRSWARLQKLGFAFLCAGLLMLVTAYVTLRLTATTIAVLGFAACGLGLLIAYVIVGNICRSFHEDV